MGQPEPVAPGSGASMEAESIAATGRSGAVRAVQVQAGVELVELDHGACLRLIADAQMDGSCTPKARRPKRNRSPLCLMAKKSCSAPPTAASSLRPAAAPSSTCRSTRSTPPPAPGWSVLGVGQAHAGLGVDTRLGEWGVVGPAAQRPMDSALVGATGIASPRFAGQTGTLTPLSGGA